MPENNDNQTTNPALEQLRQENFESTTREGYRQKLQRQMARGEIDQGQMEVLLKYNDFQSANPARPTQGTAQPDWKNANGGRTIASVGTPKTGGRTALYFGNQSGAADAQRQVQKTQSWSEAAERFGSGGASPQDDNSQYMTSIGRMQQLQRDGQMRRRQSANDNDKIVTDGLMAMYKMDMPEGQSRMSMEPQVVEAMNDSLEAAGATYRVKGATMVVGPNGDKEFRVVTVDKYGKQYMHRRTAEQVYDVALAARSGGKDKIVAQDEKTGELAATEDALISEFGDIRRRGEKRDRLRRETDARARLAESQAGLADANKEQIEKKTGNMDKEFALEEKKLNAQIDKWVAEGKISEETAKGLRLKNENFQNEEERAKAESEAKVKGINAQTAKTEAETAASETPEQASKRREKEIDALAAKTELTRETVKQISAQIEQTNKQTEAMPNAEDAAKEREAKLKAIAAETGATLEKVKLIAAQTEQTSKQTAALPSQEEAEDEREVKLDAIRADTEATREKGKLISAQTRQTERQTEGMQTGEEARAENAAKIEQIRASIRNSDAQMFATHVKSTVSMQELDEAKKTFDVRKRLTEAQAAKTEAETAQILANPGGKEPTIQYCAALLTAADKLDDDERKRIVDAVMPIVEKLSEKYVTQQSGKGGAAGKPKGEANPYSLKHGETTKEVDGSDGSKWIVVFDADKRPIRKYPAK